MSRIHLICFLFALIVASSNLAHAQILPNGDFELNCATNNAATSCITFNSACIPGWLKSHGTPQLSTTTGNVGPSSVAMWHERNLLSPDVGEGIFTTLNIPTPTRESFQLCFYYRVGADSEGPGNIVARFTTGLVEGAAAGCGEPIPNPAAELVVYNTVAVSGGWQHVVITVPPSLAAFTQLNIYPVSLTTSTLWIEVDGFELNYCATNLLATPATLPMPSGYHVRDETITASSLGGAGTVTANPNVSTTFRAGEYVLLDPNFVSTPSLGKFFLAEIGANCGCVEAAKMPGEHLTPELNLKDIDFDEHLKDQFKVFDVALHPNPANETVTLNANAGLDQVRVLDLRGKVLLERFALDGLQVMTLDVSEFPNGVYLIESQSKIGERVVTKLLKE